jgi:hypothetical protein
MAAMGQERLRLTAKGAKGREAENPNPGVFGHEEAQKLSGVLS